MHGLSENQLAVRQVEFIDIASAATDYWSYVVGRNNVDFSNFQSARCGRGPLLEGWQVCIPPLFFLQQKCIITLSVSFRKVLLLTWRKDWTP